MAITPSSETMPNNPDARPVMQPGIRPEFYVSTYNASQFYQPLPPKWLKTKTTVPKNFEKAANETLKALETLADVRAKLHGFDTAQIDLLIDHKINMNAQFTPRNAFDVSEESQLERVARLAEVRRKLATTDFGLPNLDEVLRAACENLILATGISRSHSVRESSAFLQHCIRADRHDPSSSPPTSPSSPSAPRLSLCLPPTRHLPSKSSLMTATARSAFSTAANNSTMTAKKSVFRSATSGRHRGRNTVPRWCCTCSRRMRKRDVRAT